ncbi:MAG: pyruvate formate lyase family protein [Bacilli bacterium]|jgi:pyruvate-formate lyase
MELIENYDRLALFKRGKFIMEFYSSFAKRPIRLSKSTRQFAADSLGHKYGLDTMKSLYVDLNDIPGITKKTPLEQYDLAIRRIAEQAPIRICDGERLSGAATLGQAIFHQVPADIGGKFISSVSHLTVNFEKVLKIGIRGIRKEAENAFETYRGTDREPFSRSVLNCLDSFAIYHRRYLEALKEHPEYAKNYHNLCHVPMNSPQNFHQAVQSLWFIFSFLRLCGNWPGIGRLDVLLGSYLKKDLADGTLTYDEAREILAHFFIKGCEWIRGGDYGSGDAQHYQNIVLAGIGENEEEVTNDVTYLVLDILEELNIGDFPTAFRLNSRTPAKLLRRISEVVRYGGGAIAVYNEDLVLKALADAGYSREEALKFANDGCWEVQIPGKTNFAYHPFDSLQILQHQTLKNYETGVTFSSFEELYETFVVDLGKAVDEIARILALDFEDIERQKWKSNLPCTVISIFEDDCIARGLSYFEGGAVYNIRSPHIGGLADTVNSLYSIKKLVFDEQKITLPELLVVLKNNWEGAETLRLYAKNRYCYYGNDSDEVDAIYRRLVHDFALACQKAEKSSGYRLPGGISTFGRQIEWCDQRLACSHGTKKGDILAANSSPTPGTDKEGVTAIIRSYCKANLAEMTTGAALDCKLLPSAVRGEEGIETISQLFKGFVALGGFFLQLDVVDAKILHEAQAHPENYQTLSVRVSGWNARFVTLDQKWQQMIIEQTEK